MFAAPFLHCCSFLGGGRIVSHKLRGVPQVGCVKPLGIKVSSMVTLLLLLSVGITGASAVLALKNSVKRTVILAYLRLM
jgi:hypothetical protein